MNLLLNAKHPRRSFAVTAGARWYSFKGCYRDVRWTNGDRALTGTAARTRSGYEESALERA